MISFFKRPKKLSDFEVEVLERLDCIQKSQANLRKDIDQIIHDEILRTLDFRARRTMPL
jgi:hypothetical protein